MFSRRPVAVALLTAAGFILSACGSSGQPAGPPITEPAAGYPVTIMNCGKQFTYTRTPQRVVVMNGGSVAEVSSLLALGQGSHIVANTQSYGVSDEAGRAEAIAALPTGGIHLNDQLNIPREAMLGLRPDFVISTYGGGFDATGGFATRDELSRIGANTFVPAATCGGAGTVNGTQTIEDSYAMLSDLGTIFNARDRAQTLIANSRREIGAVRARITSPSRPKIMVIIPGMAMGSGDFSSIGANGIWNDIIANAGGVNAFGDTTKNLFANLSKEQVAATDVDAVVIVSYHNPHPDQDAANLFAQFPQWSAARNKRFVVLSDSIYLGPSNAIAVERIARLIHPEAFGPA